MQAGNRLPDFSLIFRVSILTRFQSDFIAFAATLAYSCERSTGYRRAVNALNLTNTTAVNTTLAALDEAFTLVNIGAVSLQAGIEQAVTGLAERGITGAVYASGRRMELAPYVRMVVRTSVMQTTSELGFRRMDEYGSDLVVVSAHAGARPRCAPFQGRVFSRSGRHPKYPPWSSTSYGEPAGLLGINCGHWIDPFIEGVDRVPTKEERDPAKYELGKSNADVYAESQHQRYLEREVREWKHRANALSDAGLDNKTAKAKIREWQGEMRGFLERTDRTRRYDRERVFAAGATHIKQAESLREMKPCFTIDFSKDNILPGLNAETLRELGKTDKPVLLKKNVIEKNAKDHPDVRHEDAAQIIEKSLYNPDGIFPGNPEKPYFNFISRVGDDKSAVTLLELSNAKNSFEIVHWHTVRNRSRAQLERKGERIKKSE